ncbi:hypothetical protein BU17DRAFT_95223 [Hysterangium stoloniferum]|nr:hypothetical protein BU17DRAFT_95223 [Hysterangium stoloniferum]
MNKDLNDQELTGAYVVTLVAHPESLGRGASKENMDALGRIFIHTRDEQHSGALKRITEHRERAEKAEQEKVRLQAEWDRVEWEKEWAQAEKERANREKEQAEAVLERKEQERMELLRQLEELRASISKNVI